MRRRILGLHAADQCAASGVPDGLLLVRVERAQHRWQGQKPYYFLSFTILEPNSWAGRSVAGRLYCTPKALWKLSWFLRDFGYDPELLGRDEVEEKRLIELRGVVKISHTVVHDTSLLNFVGFAPASQWEELASGMNTSRPDASQLNGSSTNSSEVIG